MSEHWGGFTDEDIERIKSNPKVSVSCVDKMCEMDGSKTSTPKNRGPMKIKTMALKTVKNDQLDDGYESNSTHVETKVEGVPSTSGKTFLELKNSDQSSRLSVSEGYVSSNEQDCLCHSSCEQNGIDTEIITQNSPISDSEEKKEEKCNEDVQSNPNLLSLEIFEMRQKRVEAENARRRALINKAINDKKMRTHAEAVKLAHITQELNRIDSNLSSDVSILRDYIEKASQEFLEAEKHYLKAEKEYVDAKLVLFERMQRKEMLTEHLCAIIEQNENRKADKLVELMKQLEMDVVVEDFEINGLQPILSNLCMLNDEPYYTCQTLKPSLSKEHSLEKATLESSQSIENEEQAVSPAKKTEENSLNSMKNEDNLTEET